MIFNTTTAVQPLVSLYIARSVSKNHSIVSEKIQKFTENSFLVPCIVIKLYSHLIIFFDVFFAFLSKSLVLWGLNVFKVFFYCLNSYIAGGNTENLCSASIYFLCKLTYITYTCFLRFIIRWKFPDTTPSKSTFPKHFKYVNVVIHSKIWWKLFSVTHFCFCSFSVSCSTCSLISINFLCSVNSDGFSRFFVISQNAGVYIAIFWTEKKRNIYFWAIYT